jgi:hypothetical protein
MLKFDKLLALYSNGNNSKEDRAMTTPPPV